MTLASLPVGMTLNWRNRGEESILGRGNIYEKDQEWQRDFEVEELKEGHCGWTVVNEGQT